MDLMATEPYWEGAFFLAPHKVLFRIIFHFMVRILWLVQSSTHICVFVWLRTTPGWFRGMSQAFLSSRCVKILICSSSDRLDKELMIAHMQV